MTLQTLLEAAGCVAPADLRVAAVPVKGVEYDSRRIAAGDVFFAFQGAHVNGRDFVFEAARRGAAAVISESPPPSDAPIPWIQVDHARRVLALMARALHSEVAADVLLTGITGTNGKTTSALLLDSMLTAAGAITGVIGTVSHRIGGEQRRALNTTPESIDIYRMMRDLRAACGAHMTMEVSSHALALGRVWGIQFHTGVFTNLTADHLDFHGTMESYFNAKAELFRGQDSVPPRFAVVNADDPWSRKLPRPPGTKVIKYGLSSAAELRATDVRAGFEGLRFEMEWQGHSYPLASILTGRMNVYNILAAAGAAFSYGLTPEAVREGVYTCRAVAGRFERIDAGQPFLVIVDYAHTEDALRNAIASARGLEPARVLTAFGCGGDRDRSKRPMMGQAAGQLSDFVVVTSDNPRSEDPIAIINDVLVGLRRTDTVHVIEPDREKAIRRVIAEAGPQDIVLIAGKGHESYQVIGDRTIEFDDRVVARRILAEYGYGRQA